MILKTIAPPNTGHTAQYSCNKNSLCHIVIKIYFVCSSLWEGYGDYVLDWKQFYFKLAFIRTDICVQLKTKQDVWLWRFLYLKLCRLLWTCGLWETTRSVSDLCLDREQDPCWDCVGNNDTERQTRSSDMAELPRNATDSAGRSRMDSSPWFSRPWTTSSFTQYTIVKEKVCCSQVVSCSQETTDNKLPMYLCFTI